MIPVQLSNNRDAAQALLTHRWRNKPVISNLLRGYVGPFDELESTVFDVILRTRTLENNIGGVWLDYLGNIVGENRAGRLDASYTKGLRLRIRVNRSQGRSSDMVDVLQLWGNGARFVEYRYLSWSVEVEVEPDIIYLHRLVTEAKAASSYGITRGTTIPTTAGVGMRWGSVTTAPADDQKWDSAYG